MPPPLPPLWYPLGDALEEPLPDDPEPPEADPDVPFTEFDGAGDDEPAIIGRPLPLIK